MQAIRAASPSPAEVGITLNLAVSRPTSPEAADMAAELEARHNGVYLEPLFSGGYPARLSAEWSPALVPGLVHDGDLAVIAEPIDFLGVNYYFPGYVGVAAADGELRAGERPLEDGFVEVRPAELPVDRDGLAGRADVAARAADPGRRPRCRRPAGVHHGERLILV